MSAETKPGGGRQVMIVAGEASGDMHGAGLVRAMHRLDPTLRFSGMGGRELRAAGVEILVDAAGMAVVGAVEVLSHLGEILRARRSLIARLHSDRPDLLILIDYPDFNLLLAARAKRLGIPILYYISPQVWAWRQGRVRTIRRLVDRMLVILPFEREFYARHGVTVDFVGHPLVDTVRAALDRDRFARLHAIDPGRTLVGLLPGSRRKEVGALLPVFLGAAERLEQAHPGRCTFLIPQASTIDRGQLDRAGLAAVADRLDVRVISDDRYSMMAACDAVVAASGTVILELALLGTPTVAAYRISPHTYWMGRLLIRKIKYFTLVNLIAGREVIPELLQDAANPEQIAHELELLLEDDNRCRQMQEGLAEVRDRLGEPGAADRAAAIALEVLDERAIETNERTDPDDIEPAELPIDGTLDLHAFRPGEVKHLVPDYLAECRVRGILHVRIVHGKGTGSLRRTVHTLLDRLDTVAGYRLADESAGSWGATLVDLRPPDPPGPSAR